MASRLLTTERLVLTLATVVVVSVLAAAAWSVAVPSATATPRPTVDGDVATQYDAIDGVAATRTTTITRNGSISSRTVYDATLRPGTGKQRLEVVSSTAARYDLRVSNGSTLWLYDASHGNATRLSLSGASHDRGARLERLLARLNMTAADTRPRTVDPLPVVPHGGHRPAAVANASGTLGVSYSGTETVDGREAYVVHIAPENGTAAYEQTLWIDAERFFPLQQRTEWMTDGRRTVVTTTYTDVRYDTGAGDAAFVPDFPANTTVTAPETPEQQTYRTIDALEDDTDVRVPAVDLPPSFELAYATQTRGRIHGVGLQYVNRTSRLTVAKYNRTYVPESETVERVTVDGRTAYLSRGLTSSLSWNCGEYRYTIRGQGVSADRLVAIGQSVGCPASG